jgi:hypothetical protein
MSANFLPIAIVFLSVISSAQQPRTSQAPESDKAATLTQQTMDLQLDSDYDADMQIWLNDEGKMIQRLASLGVPQEVAQTLVHPNGEIAAYLKWQTARSGLGQRFGLLFLPCHLNWDTAYLYALLHKQGAWHVTDHIEMDCHYDESVSFDASWIRDPDHDEVLVHHDCVSHGTGYLEQHFSVFTLSAGKLKDELESTEVLHSYPIAVDRPRDLDQNSTFTVVPIRGSRSRAIEETRSSTFNGKLTVQRRTFHWNPAKGKYVPSAFTPVEVSPN